MRTQYSNEIRKEIISILRSNASSTNRMKAKDFKRYNIDPRLISETKMKNNSDPEADYIICSSKRNKGGGFWIAENQDQAKEALEEYKTTVLTMFKTLRALEKNIDSIFNKDLFLFEN